MSKRRPPRLTVRSTGTCKATGKKRFATELDAETVVANAQYAARILHHHRRQESRAYACSCCRGWHVTSTPGVTPLPQMSNG